MESIRVGPIAVTGDAGAITVAAEVHIHDQPTRLWFRVAGRQAHAAPEAFLIAMLLPAMRLGRALHMEAPVCPQLLASLERIQDIYLCWEPELERVAVVAPAAPPAAEDLPGGTASYFSGGVDSFATVLRHRTELSALIFVHGFDIRLEREGLRRVVAASLTRAAGDLGLPLVEVETNLREITDPVLGGLQLQPWELSHGAALASVAWLFAPGFRRVLIPGSFDYSQLVPWGSHPLLDPLWSGNGMEIVHDGIELPRFEKIRRIAASDAALRTLRVCWKNPDDSYNCGRCDKCLATMAALHTLGALSRCPTFARPTRSGSLSELIPGRTLFITPYLQVSTTLRGARLAGIAPMLQDRLRRALEGKSLLARLYQASVHRSWRRLMRASLRAPAAEAVEPLADAAEEYSPGKARERN